MDKRVNLAALPNDEALVLARAGGRAIFGDADAVSKVYEGLMTYWINTNMPVAVGQSEDEFGELLNEVEKEFEAGVDEAIAAAKASATIGLAVDKDRLLGSVHELTAMIWGVAGLCEVEAGAKYTGAYVQRMSDLAFEIEQAVERCSSAGEQNG